jgi:hypothetical protein
MTGSLRVFSERSRRCDSSRLAASRGRRLRFEGLETRSLLAVSIAGLAVSPDPVGPGQTLTLTAQDVQTTAGQVTNVAFYRESNGTADLQVGTGGDAPVGTDTNGADGWSAAVLINGLASGSYTYYARAAASDGNVSPAVSATSVVGQVQSITASPDRFAVRPDDAVSFDVNYATFPSATGLPGAHVRMHYNSNLLGFDGITNLLGFGAVGTAPSVNPDTKDFDHDPTTDTCVVMAWIDINSTWPGTATARLYTANFTALSSGEPNASTRINFTSGDAPADWTVSSQPAIVEINENSPPAISGVNASPQAVTDKTTVQPFSGATIADPDLQSLTTTVTLDAAAKGMLTGGFANTAPGVYSFTGSAADTTTAIRALVFHPTENRVAPGSTETTAFTISVDDGVALPVTNVATTVVSTSVNDQPTIANIPDQTTPKNTPVGPIAFTVGDPDVGSALTVTATSNTQSLVPDANITIGGSGTSRSIQVAPASGQVGSAVITVTVRDAQNTTSTDTFTLTVSDANVPPTMTTIGDRPIPVDGSTGPIPLTIADDHTPADQLTVTVTSSNTTLVPGGGLVLGGSGANRTLSVTPAAQEAGIATITVTVTDRGLDGVFGNGDDLSTSDAFVVAVHAAPTISAIPDQTIAENNSTGDLYFAVLDAETAANLLSVTGSSSNTTLVPNANIVFGGSGGTRTVRITPAAGQIGSATITLTVADRGLDGMAGNNDDLTASKSFVLTVNGANTPPTIGAIADKITAEGVPITVDFTIGDAETAVDSLLLSASSSNTLVVPNEALSFSGQGGTRHLTISPSAVHADRTVITITATDGGGLSATQTFALIVAQQIGTVGYGTANGQNPQGSDLWYAVTTQRTGTLTLIALSQTPVSGATLGLYDAGLTRLDTPGEHLLHAADPLAADRIDHEVAINQTFYVRLHAPNAAMDLYLANLLRLQSGTLLAYGTAEADQVQIVAGAERTLRLDALWYDYSATEVTTITFNGLGGRDVVDLTGSSLGESVNILPGQATLSGGEATVNLMSSETITYHSGGGSDTARLYDSDGDDTLVAGPGEATLSDGSTYQIDVQGAAIMAYAAYQGHDVAQLNDSTGANYFVNSGDIGKLIGDGISLRVFSFEEVKAHSEAGGKDSAMLFDSTGDDNLDASPGTVQLAYANGHTATAYGFASTFGYAMQGGQDTANMHGSAGVDSLTVGVVVNTQSHQTTRKATITDAANTYLNQADGFEQVTVEGDLTDHAYLYDSAGDDNFDSMPGGGTLMHSFGSITTLAGFGDVRLYSNGGGYDRAMLLGGDGNDSFLGRPDFSRFYSGGMYTWVYGFDEVHATAGAGGTDNAFLYDSTGDDRLDADADWATLHDAALAQYFLEVQGFGKVTATASTGTNLRKIVNPAFNLQYVGDWTDLA